MKGIVFNLLEEAVRTSYGEDTWDDVLDDTGLDGSYTTMLSYSDAELVALVTAVSNRTSTPPADALRWFGRRALGLLAERYPQFFRGHVSLRTFLESMESVHSEVRKRHHGATPPPLALENLPDGRISVGYSSERHLCHFAEGLIIGAAEVFGESASIVQPTCRLHGDPMCTLVVAFRPVEP
ncbi:MAG: heme NO-binding domain-containing protein [Myxococcota bacterium]